MIGTSGWASRGRAGCPPAPRRGDEAQAARAGLAQPAERGERAAAGGQHRVDDEDRGVGEAVAAASRSSRPGCRVSSSRYMPRWPRRPPGTGAGSRRPCRGPRAASRRRRSAGQAPSPVVVSSGVSTSTGRAARGRASPRRRASPTPPPSAARKAPARVPAAAQHRQVARRAAGGRRRGARPCGCAIRPTLRDSVPMQTPAPQRRAQGARSGSRRDAGAALRRTARADEGVAAPARHLLRAPARPPQAPRAGAGGAQLIAYERADAAAARASRLPPRRRPRPRGAAIAALDADARRRASWSSSAAACCSATTCASTSTTSTGSGRWVELEAVAPPGSDLDAEHAKVAELRDALGIGRRPASSPTGYAAMLLAARAARPTASCDLARARDGPRLRAVLGLRRGVALRDEAGGLHAGANVENTAYPRASARRRPRIGALVAAGGTAIARGRRHGRHRAHHALRRLPPAPARVRRPRHAGAPRGPEGVRRTVTLGDLLPLCFGAEDAARMTAAADLVRERLAGDRPDPRVGLVLGSGLGARGRRGAGRRRASRTPSCRASPSASVAGHAGRLVLGHALRRPGRGAAGPRAPLRGGRPGRRRACRSARSRALGAETHRSSRTPPAPCARRSGPVASWRSPTTSTSWASTRSSAPTTTGSGRGSRACGTPTTPALLDRAARRGRGPRRRRSPRASTSPCRARASRRPRRSARSGRSAPTPSGMSTVPETIAARHAGLRVAAVSAITNLAEGMGGRAALATSRRSDAAGRRRRPAPPR